MSRELPVDTCCSVVMCIVRAAPSSRASSRTCTRSTSSRSSSRSTTSTYPSRSSCTPPASSSSLDTLSPLSILPSLLFYSPDYVISSCLSVLVLVRLELDIAQCTVHEYEYVCMHIGRTRGASRRHRRAPTTGCASRPPRRCPPRPRTPRPSRRHVQLSFARCSSSVRFDSIRFDSDWIDLFC